jgi:hypothetical protein
MAISPTAIITREIRRSFLVLILGFAGEGPAPHGLSYVAAGGFATAREILHPAEAGFRMTSMCCVLLSRLGRLREACDAGEAVEAGVEGQDLFDSVSFHYRQVDGVASGHLRVA